MPESLTRSPTEAIPARTTTPRVICVTPARNEAWILERFLSAAELWADHVIVADQQSTDQTVAIAKQFDKVRVVTNRGGEYDEGKRQQLLLAAAREFPGPRVIVALDADEFLSPSWDSVEWQQALQSSPGTVLAFDWVNILPDGTHAWIPPQKIPYGFVDDGSDHAGERIHATRIPVHDHSPIFNLSETRVLHFQYTDWPRMKSKQRWYQCWERVNHPQKRPIQIYRQYHRMDAFPPDQVHQIPPTWIPYYAERGVDLRPHASAGPFWWDDDVVDWLRAHGTERFRRLDIWDIDWAAVATELGRTVSRGELGDPTTSVDRAVLKFLRATQKVSQLWPVRLLQRLLSVIGW